MQTFTVTEVEKGWRLDAFLASCSGLSRSMINKLISSGQVTINGLAQTKPAKRLLPGELCCMFVPAPEMIAKNKSLCEKIHILYEDAELLVVSKPAGLLTHGDSDGGEYTLAHWLRDRCPGVDEVGEGRHRGGILHRLDRETSGLILLVKAQPTYLRLKRAMQMRQITREYKAIVYGTPRQRCGILEHYIVRAKCGGRKAVLSPTPNARKAITYYQVEGISAGFSHIRCALGTGRTHQIRLQLSAIGHPVVGDKLYGGRKRHSGNALNPVQFAAAGERHMLHAYKLAFARSQQNESADALSAQLFTSMQNAMSWDGV